MVRLHHFGTDDSAFHLNPDLIVSIEAKPDTIIQLTNGHELYVAEKPEAVVQKILAWRQAVQASGPTVSTGDGEVRADA